MPRKNDFLENTDKEEGKIIGYSFKKINLIHRLRDMIYCVRYHFRPKKGGGQAFNLHWPTHMTIMLNMTVDFDALLRRFTLYDSLSFFCKGD